MARSTGQKPSPIVLGWREWISLDEWGIDHLKAKVDTGARTSSLHAFGLETFDRDGVGWVRFEIHPWQRSESNSVVAESRVVDTRPVKSSSGQVEERPIIHTPVTIAGRSIEVELTLTNRDEMGFRMLLGRQAVRGRFLVDPGASYLGGRPPRAIRRLNRQEA